MRSHSPAACPADSAEPPPLEVSDLSVSFGGVAGLSGVSLSVRPRQIVAIVGPNGAGKSTILNCISGLLGKHPEGKILLFGEPISGGRAGRATRPGVGRSFQDPPLLDGETVIENLLGGAHATLKFSMIDQMFRPWQVRRQEAHARDRATELLDLCGLTSQMETTAGALSYGERKLVDIVRSLMGRPALALLDEPTSGLDGGEQEIVASLLQEIRRREGTAMVVVEHHMQLVRRIADQVIGLQAGSVLATGSPGDVLDSEEFRHAIVGGHQGPRQAPGHKDGYTDPARSL